MSWTAPRTWVTGETLTSTLMNTHLRDQLAYLKGEAGTPTLEDGIIATYFKDSIGRVTTMWADGTGPIKLIGGKDAATTTDGSGAGTISFGITFVTVLFVFAAPRETTAEQLAVTSNTLTDFTIGWLNHSSHGPFTLDWFAGGT